MTTRPDRVAQLIVLQRQGFTSKEMAVRLGISYTTVRDLISDPTGEKAKERRKRYAGICESCGSPTTGCNGRASAPRLCASCTTQNRNAQARQRIIEGILHFAQETGRPPTAEDFNPAQAANRGRFDKAYLFMRNKDKWPYTNSVLSVFGSWNTAIEAAGFDTKRPGERR